jgi:hypothetical protein
MPGGDRTGPAGLGSMTVFPVGRGELMGGLPSVVRSLMVV